MLINLIVCICEYINYLESYVDNIIDKIKITDNMRFYGVYKEGLLNGCVQIVGKDEN